MPSRCACVANLMGNQKQWMTACARETLRDEEILIVLPSVLVPQIGSAPLVTGPVHIAPRDLSWLYRRFRVLKKQTEQ